MMQVSLRAPLSGFILPIEQQHTCAPCLPRLKGNKEQNLSDLPYPVAGGESC